jgi:APA family basic amino acid/polyamine antiporter
MNYAHDDVHSSRMESVNAQPTLKRSIGLSAIVAFGLGTAVGVSVFSAIGPAYALAGPGMLISVLLAIIPMLFVAIAYAFLGATSPSSGASYEWPRRFLHPAAGFAVAWFRIAGNTGALIVLGLVLTRYLGMIMPLPVKPTMAALFTVVLALNLFGVGGAARAQKLLMLLLLLIFAVFCIWGASSSHADFARLSLARADWSGTFAALPLLIGLFFGIEAATEVGEEVRDNRRDIPLGIALSIGSAAATYFVVSAVAIALLGDRLGTSEAPLLDAARVFMGTAALPVIVAGAVVAIGKSMNAIFLIFSRGLLAMARAGTLPSALARIHPQWRTPWIACLTVYACTMAGLLLPTELTFLFLAVSAPTLFKYGCVCLSAARVARAAPELGAKSGLGLSSGTIRAVALIGTVLTTGVFLIGIDTDWRPYALLGGWGAIGAVWYGISTNKKDA